jgi:hypothetical protein
MTPDEKLNENRKLLANLLNAVANSVLTVGTFVPAAQFLFGFLPAGANEVLLYGTGLICIGTAVLIHLLGHLVLRSLQ